MNHLGDNEGTNHLGNNQGHVSLKERKDKDYSGMICPHGLTSHLALGREHCTLLGHDPSTQILGHSIDKTKGKEHIAPMNQII